MIPKILEVHHDTLKSRFLTLASAMVLPLLLPIFLGAVSTPEATTAPYVACATEEEEEEGSGGNGSYYPKTALCGQNYPGYHFVDGSCPDDE